MQIDDAVLRMVMKEAAARFPYMAVGLTEADGRYVYEPLDSDVPVFAADGSEPSSFDDPRLNGYLFRVSYRHKSLYVDYHRSIADESGMMTFVKAILLRYLELSGYSVRTDGSVKLLSSDTFKAEYDDSMMKMEDVHASRPVWYMDAKAVLPEIEDRESEVGVQIRVSLSKLKKDHADMSSIPVTYLAPILSHAIQEVYGREIEMGEYVVAAVHVDLRPYYPSATLRPYKTPVYLAYNRNLTDYPYTTVLMSQKKLLEAQLKNDTLAYSAQRLISDVEKAESASEDITAMDRSFSTIQENLRRRSTYDICRIGNIVLPDTMQRLVTEFYPVIPSSGRVCSATVETYRGEMVVNISGCQNIQRISERLVEMLQENSIAAYVSECYEYRPMKMK